MSIFFNLRLVFHDKNISIFYKIIVSTVFVLFSIYLLFFSYLLYEYSNIINSKNNQMSFFINTLNSDYALLLNKVDFINKSFQNFELLNLNKLNLFNNNFINIMNNIVSTLSDIVRFKIFKISKFDISSFKDVNTGVYFYNKPVNN